MALEAICRRQEALGEPVGQATRIRSKYGSLRIYVEPVPNEDQENIIQAIEDKSEEVCELCGKPAATIEQGDWLATLCRPHANEWKEKGGRLFLSR